MSNIRRLTNEEYIGVLDHFILLVTKEIGSDKTHELIVKAKRFMLKDGDKQ